MSNIRVHQPDAIIGDAPAQQLHVIDERDLRQIGSNGVGLYLALALSCIPTGLGIGATVAAWHATIPPETSLFDNKWGASFLSQRLCCCLLVSPS